MIIIYISGSWKETSTLENRCLGNKAVRLLHSNFTGKYKSRAAYVVSNILWFSVLREHWFLLHSYFMKVLIQKCIYGRKLFIGWMDFVWFCIMQAWIYSWCHSFCCPGFCLGASSKHTLRAMDTIGNYSKLLFA